MSSPMQFRGRLTNAEIAQGMTAALSNARRLLADAVILLDAKRFPTAASLAVLSIEESGKSSILRAMSVARTDKDVSNLWKDARRTERRTPMAAWSSLCFTRGAQIVRLYGPLRSGCRSLCGTG